MAFHTIGRKTGSSIRQRPRRGRGVARQGQSSTARSATLRISLASCLRLLAIVVVCSPAWTLAANPTISQQPESLRQVVAGGTTSFTVVASPSAPNKTLSYQWRRRAFGSDTNNPNVWTNISGAQSSTLTLSNVPQSSDNFYYNVIVSEPGGSVSSNPNAGLLRVYPPIQITSLPPDQTFA